MSAAPLSFPRKLGYAAILTVVTLALLLGVTEMLLRLAGFGYSSHLFRRVTLPGGEKIWRENRWCTAPYFSTELVRRPQPIRLPAKKAPGTYRIFVLGSSAAMGDPEPAFSLARMLEAMLRAAYPDRHFVVVNAAITAVNSHLVRGFAADCAALEPDLFCIASTRSTTRSSVPLAARRRVFPLPADRGRHPGGCLDQRHTYGSVIRSPRSRKNRG